MNKIKISEVNEIRAQLGATHLVLFAVAPDGTQHVATHGGTEVESRQAAEAGNNLKTALGWDKTLCRDEPLERRCKNCTFYEADYGMHCFNGWSKDGSTGFCQMEPVKTNVTDNQKCRHFEPRY